MNSIDSVKLVEIDSYVKTDIVRLLIEYGEECASTVGAISPDGLKFSATPTFEGFIQWLRDKRGKYNG